ncbi:MAG: S8 family serine peptidase [Meiothermus sp.]|uniref:S8 family serine peptidase n=1 Tax=Meiothermus sp. TaxID=1955249 RepID=UPI0026002F86|nr:S8 family serine peptidase [Meiothermus sp.]MCS7067497.1 S8 family serine peptidase [Meiothermus sp.]MDW8424409.1 S8 family serine peptidase [Meiothermus sp.]
MKSNPARSLLKVALLAISLLLMAAQCGGGTSPNQLPPSTFRIVPSLSPQVAAIPDPDGGAPRPVGALRGKSGLQSEFVLNELLVSSDDTAKVEALAARYGGRVLRTIALEGAPKLHLVRVNASPAVEAQLAQDLQTLVPGARSDLEFSSQEGLNLLATAAREGVSQNLKVSLNFVLNPQGFAEATALEAGISSVAAAERDLYNSNAFGWPYMNRGSAQDIGVGEAWRLLQAAGRLSSRVKIAIIDGGFERDHPDYPAQRSIYGGASWGAANPQNCGGGPCPWHGTLVAQAAMGQPDNNQGAAGPAGPIAELMAVQVPGDFFEFLRFVVTTLAGALAERPRIINMSAAGAIPAVPGALLDATVTPLLLTIETSPFRPIFFASAGNNGRNVDAEDCFLGICWEEDLWVPCELLGMICVGGMGWDSAARAANSNFGSNSNFFSVDIYGPYTVWAGPDPERREVRRVNGTSFASPFVAGVAALIWAANPALLPFQVEQILYETAHNGGVHGSGGHQRRVNAFAAVSRALGNVPPFVRIDSPREGQVFSWRLPVLLNATTYDPDTPGTPSLSWSSNLEGNLGSGNGISASTLRPGNHRISVAATSGGQNASAGVNISIRNDPPTVQIVEPVSGSTLCTNTPIDFRATVSDPNNFGAYPFPSGNVVWRIGGTSFASGLSASRAFSSPGSYTVNVQATDDAPAPHALSSTDSRTITVQSCVNNPPSANITHPASDLNVYADRNDANGWYYELTLRASASDPDGDPLTLQWFTDRADVQPGPPASGEQLLGSGSETTVRLYGGSCGVSHNITLRVSDRVNTIVRTRLIRVNVLC